VGALAGSRLMRQATQETPHDEDEDDLERNPLHVG
jgi:hypothetical protein